MDKTASMAPKRLTEEGEDIVPFLKEFINYYELFPDGGAFILIHQLQLRIWGAINYVFLLDDATDMSSINDTNSIHP